jgi:hypothetical protein
LEVAAAIAVSTTMALEITEAVGTAMGAATITAMATATATDMGMARAETDTLWWDAVRNDSVGAEPIVVSGAGTDDSLASNREVLCDPPAG